MVLFFKKKAKEEQTKSNGLYASLDDLFEQKNTSRILKKITTMQLQIM